MYPVSVKGSVFAAHADQLFVMFQDQAAARPNAVSFNFSQDMRQLLVEGLPRQRPKSFEELPFSGGPKSSFAFRITTAGVILFRHWLSPSQGDARWL